MATVKPFAALRPDPALAARICELPYDVLSSAEARGIAGSNPLSFFHVSKPEIDLAADIDPHDARVYAKGRENFVKLIRDGALRQDRQPGFYLYRQTMGSHSQLGLVALASCDEYVRNVVKRHELTRPDKEDDRVRHIETLASQTGPAFLTYVADPTLDACFSESSAGAPEIDFVASDGVRHSSWSIHDPKTHRLIADRFAAMPALYIADGHHRTAAAARVWKSRNSWEASAYFLSVLFPHDQVQILPYHRVVRDLNGRSRSEILEQLQSVFTIQQPGKSQASRRHEIGFLIGQEWLTLTFRPQLTETNDPMERLDVHLLQKYVLEPLFGIENPRTSERINFVGGIRGPGELERLVKSGAYACAFSLYPTGIQDLMAIADAEGLMPPKSTWFEPKLRDAMFCHLLQPASEILRLAGS